MKKLTKKDVKYVPFLDPNYEKDKLKEWKTIDYNKRGILGDPFHASVKKGESWYKNLIKNIKSLIENEL
jgi:creatinine amidohydrolase/Fe(II)-dependent formamide hydrolase-like protein